MNLMTNSELASYLRLSKPTLWRYRKRYPDFPEPIIIKGSGVLRWVADEVNAWLLANRNNEGAK